MDRDNFSCRSCGEKESTLNVHHAFYIKGQMPWEYDNSMLFTFCECCHEGMEERIKDIRLAASSMTALDVDNLFCEVFYAIEKYGLKSVVNACRKMAGGNHE